MYVLCRLIMLFISEINCSAGGMPMRQFGWMLMFFERFFLFPLEVLQ